MDVTSPLTATIGAVTRTDSRYYLAPVAGVGWLAGIGLASLSDAGTGFWLVMAVAAAAGTVATWRAGRLGLGLAAVAALALGAARYVAAQPLIDTGHVAYYNNSQAIDLHGEVVADPDVGDTRRQLRVAARELVVDGQPRPVQGLVLVQTALYPTVGYGAALRLSGDLLPPEALGSDSYAAYLRRQGIQSVMRRPLVTVVGKGGTPFMRALLAVRDRGRDVLAASLPEPQAALLTGILLGDDSALPKGAADAFRATGMTHIIAISGFNIALIIALLDRLSAPLLPRRTAALAVMAGIGLYTLLVGASASVVRAALMGVAYLIALRLLGQPTLAVAGLFTAAFVMTLLNPLALWDIGFQLSLAATLGLLLYAGPWTQRLRRGAGDLPRPALSLLTEGLVVTLAAQLLTLPLILFHFGRLSLASLPANLLVLPAQPAVMLTGGLTLLLGLLWPPLGRLAGLPAWLFLTYTLAVIEWLARWPAASVPLRLSSWGLVVVYAAIAGLTLLAMAEKKQRERFSTGLRARKGLGVALGALAVVVLLFGAWLLQRPDGRLHVAFLDVGQGDATLITSPDGRQVLIDGGRYPSALLDELGEQMPFWDRSIDLLIATHPDDDHVAGLVEVAERYDVGQLVTNGATADGNAAYATLLAAVNADAIHVAQPGETINLGDGARLEIIQGGRTGLSDNDGSVVARLVYGELTVLLTGDAGEAAEAAMARDGRPLAAVVLKAGHHGAKTSSSDTFLRAVAPQFVVISAGAGNSYGHPAPEMLARAAAIGATVLRTDEMGTIEVSSDGERMWWATEVPDQ